MSFLIALWLLGSRILVWLFWPAGFALWGVLAWLLVRWYTRHVIVEPPKQEPLNVEEARIEAFDAEYYELYQMGLWLLQHRTEAPYDDL